MDYYFFTLWMILMVFTCVKVITAYYFLQKKIEALQITLNNKPKL